MNFYRFHIGDYASHTRHLSWLEDAAYRRLLDVYYVTERALPLDERALYRLVVAQADDQREAVRSVLSEFFQQTEQGWRHERCEAEIAEAQDKQAAASERKQGEHERQQRHRERRAELFAALRARGVVPAYDAPMRELQQLHDMHCNAPETVTGHDLQREGNGYTTPTPTPTPTPKEKNTARVPRFDAVASLVLAGVDESLARDFLAVRRAKRAPLTAAGLDSLKREAAKARMPLDAVLRECCARGWQGFKAEWMLGLPMHSARGADVARATVPGPQGPDPALQKLRQDEKRAAPMPAEVRAKLAALAPGRKAADRAQEPSSDMPEGVGSGTHVARALEGFAAVAASRGAAC